MSRRPHLRAQPEQFGNMETQNYVKACTADRPALKKWVRESVGGEITPCRTCYSH